MAAEKSKAIQGLGDLKGRKARAEKMTPEESYEATRKAAKARWDKRRREEST